MEQLTNYKHKINFLISENTPLNQLTQNIFNEKMVLPRCNECNRIFFNESHKICNKCYNIKTIIKTIIKPKLSGNKVIDDFIRYTQINNDDTGRGKMEFVPYEQFKNIEFIAEGGFSKIYKATWVDGPINNWHDIESYNYKVSRYKNYTVVLKKLNNSKNITSKELNEVQYNTCNILIF